MGIKMISKDGKTNIESHPSNVASRLTKGWKLETEAVTDAKGKAESKSKKETPLTDK